MMSKHAIRQLDVTPNAVREASSVQRCAVRPARMWVGLGVLAVAGTASKSVAAGCETDIDCKGGRVCVAGACTEPANECGNDLDCPGDAICAAGVCKAVESESQAPIRSLPPAGPDHSQSALSPRSSSTVPVSQSGPPVGYDVESEGIAGLWITGVVTLTVAYLAGFGSSVAGMAASGDSWPALGMIPVVGGFVLTGTHGGSGEDTLGGASPVPAIASAVETVGLLMIILGVSIRHEVQVPRHAILSDSRHATLEVLPAAFDHGVGIGLNLRAAQ